MTVIPVKRRLQDEGRPADFSAGVTLSVGRELFEAPAIDKRIVNVGFMIKPAGAAPLDGVAELEVSYEGATPTLVTTNDKGIAATAPNQPAGTGLAELEAMAHDKPLAGTWTIKIVDMPGGLGTDEIDEVFLLLNYEFAS